MNQNELRTEISRCVSDSMDIIEMSEQDVILFHGILICKNKDNKAGYKFIEVREDALAEKFKVIEGTDGSVGLPEELYICMRRARTEYYDSLAAILKSRGYNL